MEIKLPDFSYPQNIKLPAPVLQMPRAEIPSYRPLFLPPRDDTEILVEAEPEPVTEEDVEKAITERLEPLLRQLQAPPLQQDVESTSEVIQVRVPGTEIDLPLPKAEILSAAATTSVISVGATLTATSLFKKMVTVMKPAVKFLVKKIQSHQDLVEE